MTRLLFGLGNPGKRYAQTRHNAGWQVLDRLAEMHGTGFRRTRLLHGEVADFRASEQRIRMVKPASFMNRVGPVFLRALEVYELEVDDGLVLVDDFALPFGRLRFRAAGSAGGHNGLRSVEATLGDRSYPRLRIGVGPAPQGAQWADYVLKRYDADQRRGLPDLLDRAAAACLLWVAEGLEAAANRYNADPEAQDPGPEGPAPRARPSEP